MAIAKVVGGFAARFQAECRGEAVARRGAGDAFAGVAAAQEYRAVSRRGAGIAVLLMPQPLQQQGFEIEIAQHAQPMAAEFAILLSRDGVKARAAAAVV